MGFFSKKKDDSEYCHDENWMFGLQPATCQECGATRVNLYNTKYGKGKFAQTRSVCKACSEEYKRLYSE